jgi:hypothetical protein
MYNDFYWIVDTYAYRLVLITNLMHNSFIL